MFQRLATVLIAALTFIVAQPAVSRAMVGPRPYYLTVGDSIGAGFQPNNDFAHSYAEDLFGYLKPLGTTDWIDVACSGETSSTLVDGGCKYQSDTRFTYQGPQLQAAVDFIAQHAGQVSPVTMEIGINDFAVQQAFKTCDIAPAARLNGALAAYESNAARAVAELQRALGGQGDLFVLANYPGRANQCATYPALVAQFNARLTKVASAQGATVVDLASVFGGSKVPNPTLCAYTWICSSYADIHPTSVGYAVIANAIERAAGYGPVPPVPRAGVPKITKAVGPASGTRTGKVVSGRTQSYSFTARASGPATVGMCPTSAKAPRATSIQVLHAGEVVGQDSEKDTSYGTWCSYAAIVVKRGHQYKVIVGASGSGSVSYQSAWSINRTPVESKHSGRGNGVVSFGSFGTGVLHARVCVRSGTVTAAFRQPNFAELVSAKRPGRCVTLNYRTPTRNAYLLQVSQPSTPWTATLTTP